VVSSERKILASWWKREPRSQKKGGREMQGLSAFKRKPTFYEKKIPQRRILGNVVPEKEGRGENQRERASSNGSAKGGKKDTEKIDPEAKHYGGKKKRGLLSWCKKEGNED